MSNHSDFKPSRLGKVSRPRQWPTINQEVIRKSGPYPVYGANGVIGFYDSYTHEKPTVAITCRGSTCGEIHLTPENSYITGNAMALDELDTSLLDQRYLYHFLKRDGLKDCITGSAQPQIIGSALKDFLVWHPPLESQRAITQILDTLDTQIQRTEALIAKLEKVKEGLLHDLLIRGIDENGHLRPSHEQAPELYKESPLGLIPREWESQLLGDAAKILHGYAFEGGHFSDQPVGKRLLTPGNFHRNGGLYFEAGNSKWFFGKIPPGYVLRGNDAVTVMTDLSPKALILGRAVVLEEGEELLHNQRIGKITLQDQDSNYIDFLVLTINSHRFRRQVIAEATGTTVRHTSPERMMSVKVALPPKKEQLRITRAYQSNKDSIVFEKAALQKMMLKKSSLMDDLLTGRVRVTQLLEQAKEVTSA